MTTFQSNLLGEPMATPELADAPPNRGVDALDGFDVRFSGLYNRESFLFAHGLNKNPLFELPSLAALAQRRAAISEFAYWSNGPVDVSDRWEKGSAARYSLPETIANIANNNSLVMLRRLDQDDIFGPFIRTILERVVDMAGPQMRDDLIIGRGTILIASPHRLTAYHIDSDINFLFQVAGDKQISVFDQTNKAVISDQELERYYVGDQNGAQFEDRKQAYAKTYDFRAGCGVHIPCMAPHWAKNGDKVSIALSLNFDLKSIARLSRVYQVNHALRRLGAKPVPPGTSAWRDRVKLGAHRGLVVVRRLTKKHSDRKISY
jgi:hypothetical protein